MEGQSQFTLKSCKWSAGIWNQHNRWSQRWLSSPLDSMVSCHTIYWGRHGHRNQTYHQIFPCSAFSLRHSSIWILLLPWCASYRRVPVSAGRFLIFSKHRSGDPLSAQGDTHSNISGTVSCVMIATPTTSHSSSSVEHPHELVLLRDSAFSRSTSYTWLRASMILWTSESFYSLKQVKFLMVKSATWNDAVVLLVYISHNQL